MVQLAIGASPATAPIGAAAGACSGGWTRRGGKGAGAGRGQKAAAASVGVDPAVAETADSDSHPKPAASAPPQRGQSISQQKELEYQKQVAQKLLDAMDEESLWHLASVLQHRGFIQASSSGLQATHAAKRAIPAPAQGSIPCASPLKPGFLATGTAPPSAQASAASDSSSAHVATPPKSPAGRVQMSLAEALQPALAAASTISDTSSQPGQSVAELGDAGNKEDTDKADDGTATTLTLRNLPPSFDQQTTREWVDSKGYKGAYDFLLWFPAKKTSRLNTSSYAFVNFCGPDLAKRFRQENHLLRFSSEGGDELDKKQQWPLSIAVAKVQGFAENYLRFHHLTDDNSPTLCQPYFASDSLGLLPQETRDAAATAPTQAPKPVDTLPDFGSVITLILRNLPLSMNTQDRARQWLDKSGFEGQYDFFLYLPAKRRRPEQIAQGGPPQGLGYAFVNFQACEHAKRCAETLNGRAFTEGDPALNVVPARIQGLEECMRHFKSLAGSGRVAPWIEAAALRQCSARQFQ